MPYITQVERAKVDTIVSFNDIKDASLTVGQLNYIITKILHNYLDQSGKNYTNMNNVIGVLECAKLELYRRQLAPYEDLKIQLNGDV
jgi:hypothetical protein